MTRKIPKLTVSQLGAIAKQSRAELNRNISTNQAIEEFNQLMEKSSTDLARYKRSAVWTARLLLIPCLVIAIGLTLMNIHGLVVGEIKEANRYGGKMVSLAFQTTQYWLSVIFHSALSAFFWWMILLNWRGARPPRV